MTREKLVSPANLFRTHVAKDRSQPGMRAPKIGRKRAGSRFSRLKRCEVNVRKASLDDTAWKISRPRMADGVLDVSIL